MSEVLGRLFGKGSSAPSSASSFRFAEALEPVEAEEALEPVEADEALEPLEADKEALEADEVFEPLEVDEVLETDEAHEAEKVFEPLEADEVLETDEAHEAEKVFEPLEAEKVFEPLEADETLEPLEADKEALEADEEVVDEADEDEACESKVSAGAFTGCKGSGNVNIQGFQIFNPVCSFKVRNRELVVEANPCALCTNPSVSSYMIYGKIERYIGQAPLGAVITDTASSARICLPTHI
jgi:hypothetical protein